MIGDDDKTCCVRGLRAFAKGTSGLVGQQSTDNGILASMQSAFVQQATVPSERVNWARGRGMRSLFGQSVAVSNSASLHKALSSR